MKFDDGFFALFLVLFLLSFSVFLSWVASRHTETIVDWIDSYLEHHPRVAQFLSRIEKRMPRWLNKI